MAFPWDDGILVRGTIWGDDGTGTYRPVQVDAAGNLSISGAFTATLTSEGTRGAAMPATSIAVGALQEGTGNLGTLQVDADNNLHVTARTGFPDPGNTFSGPLAGGETWTGTWVDAEEFPYISVAMKSDQVSATDGWKLQFSSNGLTLGCEFTLTYDSTLVGNGHSFVIQRRGRYFRLSYTNGATPCTVTLINILQKAGNVGEAIVVDKPVLPHYVSLLTKAVIAGHTTAGGGSYVDVKVNPSGALTAEVTGTVAVSGVTGDVTVLPKSGTPAVTQVAASASNVTLKAANANRRGLTLYNDSNSAVYVKLGATASSTSFTIKMQANSYYEVPFGYTGIVDAIWVTATGNMYVTELTT